MTFLKNLTIERRQKLLAGLVGSVIIVIVALIFWMIDEDGFGDKALREPVHKTSLTTAQDRLNPQAVWVERMENHNKITQKKIEALEKTLKAFMKDKGGSPHPVTTSGFGVGDDTLSGSLPGANGDDVIQNKNAPILPPLDFGEPVKGKQKENNPLIPPGIRKVVLNLGKSPFFNKKEKAPDAVENTIPANAYATAVILGGVDASTSVHASGNPRPVLLRILDKGNLPRHFKSDLKNCRVSASAYGDISSERVYMRLEKLTCMERLTGETIQTQVAGYVLGEDGRAGVRGVVADRAGEMMRQTLLGGFLSGMSQFFGAQQQSSVFPVSPFGQTKALSTKKMVTSSFAQGTSNALEKYADFFIKRAEQLQPVLQVAAGRKVDIVFTEGTRLGETSVRKAIERIRNQSRAQAVSQFEHQGAGAGNWLPPMNGESK